MRPIPASALCVSDDFEPFCGIAASDDDLMDEAKRLEMLADLHLTVRFCWSIVNPGAAFVDNHHVAELCKQFMAYVHGTCAETTACAMPPGVCKSTVISQIGPVWGWLHYPHFRWGFASHSLQQAIQDSVKRRAILADPDFQRVFRPESGPPSWEIRLSPQAREEITMRRSRAWRVLKGQDGKARFVNSERGSMRAVSAGSKVTGDHFDRPIADDAMDIADRHKPEKTVDWLFNVYFTRLRDGAMKWNNAHRIHPRDPIGVTIERARETGMLGKAGPGGVDYLCFPHHFAPDDPDRQCVSSVGACDRRTVKGELLWPARFPESWLKEKERTSGAMEYAALYEQNTRLEAGMMFDPKSWQRFTVDPGGGWLEVSIDSSNWSERAAADQTAITVSRIVGGRLYRLQCYADRYTLPEVLDIVAKLALENPLIRRWHVEDRAGGRGLIQAMKAGGEYNGQKWRISEHAIVPVNPQKMGGDLVFRADAATPAVRAGVCFVLAGPEGDAFIKTMADFPNVWPDDVVASWVQQVTDPEVSKQLGHKPAPGPMPKMRVTKAAVDARRGR